MDVKDKKLREMIPLQPVTHTGVEWTLHRNKFLLTTSILLLQLHKTFPHDTIFIQLSLTDLLIFTVKIAI